jgi:hypothetical protein
MSRDVAAGGERDRPRLGRTSPGHRHCEHESLPGFHPDRVLSSNTVAIPSGSDQDFFRAELHVTGRSEQFMATRVRSPRDHAQTPSGEPTVAYARAQVGTSPSERDQVSAEMQQMRSVSSEPGCASTWGGVDSNHRPTDYESAALTN